MPIYNLMEDAATAEISRAQVWQWAKHGAKLEDGRPVTPELVKADHCAKNWRKCGNVPARSVSKRASIALAAELFGKMMLSGEFSEFLTLPAYEYLD